jgi:SPP1 family predicted phage head-tail adaptor
MGAGSYRNRITIQRDTGTEVDDHNQRVPVWTGPPYFENVFAAIDTGGSHKFYAAQQVHAELTHLVTIRFLRNLDHTARMRIVWHEDGQADRTLWPMGPPVNPDGRHKELEFRCKERTNE